MSLFLSFSSCSKLCGEQAFQSSSSAHVPGQLPEKGEVVATVNGVNIHQNTVDAILIQFPADQLKNSRLKEEWIR